MGICKTLGEIGIFHSPSKNLTEYLFSENLDLPVCVKVKLSRAYWSTDLIIFLILFLMSILFSLTYNMPWSDYRNLNSGYIFRFNCFNANWKHSLCSSCWSIHDPSQCSSHHGYTNLPTFSLIQTHCRACRSWTEGISHLHYLFSKIQYFTYLFNQSNI